MKMLRNKKITIIEKVIVIAVMIAIAAIAGWSMFGMIMSLMTDAIDSVAFVPYWLALMGVGLIFSGVCGVYEEIENERKES